MSRNHSFVWPLQTEYSGMFLQQVSQFIFKIILWTKETLTMESLTNLKKSSLRQVSPSLVLPFLSLKETLGLLYLVTTPRRTILLSSLLIKTLVLKAILCLWIQILSNPLVSLEQNMKVLSTWVTGSFWFLLLSSSLDASWDSLSKQLKSVSEQESWENWRRKSMFERMVL